MPEDIRKSIRVPIVNETRVVQESYEVPLMENRVALQALNPKGQVTSNYRETGEPARIFHDKDQIGYRPGTPDMAYAPPHGELMPPNRHVERSRMSLGHRMLRTKGGRYDSPSVADSAGRRFGVPGYSYGQPGWAGQGGVAQRPLGAIRRRRLPNAYKAERGYFQDTYGAWRQVQGRTPAEAMERSNFQGIAFGSRRYGMSGRVFGVTQGDAVCHAADMQGKRGCQVRVGAVDCYFNSEGEVWCAWASDLIHGKISLPKKAKQMLAQAKPNKNKLFTVQSRQAQLLVNELRRRLLAEGCTHRLM